MSGLRGIAGGGALALAVLGAGPGLRAENGEGSDAFYDVRAQAGGVAWADSTVVTVNLAGFGRYTLRSEPAGAVTQSAVVIPGTGVVTPDLVARADFGYWTLDGVRQENGWGVASTQLSFTMGTGDREAVAYLFSGDVDGDGVPDAYEQRHYGTLAHDADSDTDTDGITLLDEYTGGTSPVWGNRSQAGGVVWADSGMVTVNLAGFARYTLRSEPAGSLAQSAVVTPGTGVVTPDLVTNPDFGYWTLDGVRQEDLWGVAVTRLRFTVDGADREAVAYLIGGDVDGDGVPDAYERRFFGTLANGTDADDDADGFTLLAEYRNGTHPRFANRSQAGGVVWADSALVEVNLRPEIAVEQPAGHSLAGGDSQDFGSVPVGNSTHLTFTVRNLGGVDLTGLTLTGDGAHAAEFEVTTGPATAVGAGGSTTFTVRFSPTAEGARSAWLHLANNDTDENPFDLALTGRGAASFTSWQQRYFTVEELANPAVSGPQVMLTVDGLSNLVKYALGFEPRVVVGAGLPEVTATSTEWIYTYTRPADRADVTYAVEVSTEMSTWSENGVVHERVSSADGIETWRGRIPLGAAPNVFFRLKVERP